jgi:hypothetical protein
MKYLTTINWSLTGRSVIIKVEAGRSGELLMRRVEKRSVPLLRLALTFFVLPMGAAWVQSATAGPALQLRLEAASRVWLEGTSTLHPFSSTSTAVAVKLDPGAAASPQEIAQHGPELFTVTIPVKTLKSGESGLDKNLYKAMQARAYPEIRFLLRHYAAAVGADDVPFKAEGQLTIHGVEKPVTLEGTGRTDSQTLVADGTYSLLMSDYGVKPPRLMLGMLKVGDRVVIRFHLQFASVTTSESHL